jgi:MoxR-like ATPase
MTFVGKTATAREELTKKLLGQEVGTLGSAILIMTTNDKEAEIPDPFLRRCLIVRIERLNSEEIEDAAKQVLINPREGDPFYTSIKDWKQQQEQGIYKQETDKLRRRLIDEYEPSSQSHLHKIAAAIEYGRAMHEKWLKTAVSLNVDDGARTIQLLMSCLQLAAVGCKMVRGVELEDGRYCIKE